mmetsp:Transcript_4575/g.12932  ORF Transcript_4575/g.12932 Transcript_4575/m.12932 type:complete len:308 (-) Transcript_4575:612-1535(-)
MTRICHQHRWHQPDHFQYLPCSASDGPVPCPRRHWRLGHGIMLRWRLPAQIATRSNLPPSIFGPKPRPRLALRPNWDPVQQDGRPTLPIEAAVPATASPELHRSHQIHHHLLQNRACSAGSIFEPTPHQIRQVWPEARSCCEFPFPSLRDDHLCYYLCYRYHLRYWKPHSGADPPHRSDSPGSPQRAASRGPHRHLRWVRSLAPSAVAGQARAMHRWRQMRPHRRCPPRAEPTGPDHRLRRDCERCPAPSTFAPGRHPPPPSAGADSGWPADPPVPSPPAAGGPGPRRDPRRHRRRRRPAPEPPPRQ